MKKFVGLILVFGISAFVVKYKPSLVISPEYKGLYDTPLSELIYLDGRPLSSFATVNENDYHEFNVAKMPSNASVLDKVLYVTDSIHDNGGLLQIASRKAQDKFGSKLPLMNMKMEEVDIP